jgi:hypothetical protein
MNNKISIVRLVVISTCDTNIDVELRLQYKSKREEKESSEVHQTTESIIIHQEIWQKIFHAGKQVFQCIGVRGNV